MGGWVVRTLAELVCEPSGVRGHARSNRRRPGQTGRQSGGGFTLVELLLVIAILLSSLLASLLLALLLPTAFPHRCSKWMKTHCSN